MEHSPRTILCTHCNREMSSHHQDGSRVRYFHCSGCHRWVSSAYAEVLQGNASFQAEQRAEAGRSEQFEELKRRLDRWLERVEGRDPYRILGVSPKASFEELRGAYRRAALENHPDRGGSVEKMAELNMAFDRIREHHQVHGARPALPPNGTRVPTWRPTPPPVPAERVYRPVVRSTVAAR